MEPLYEITVDGGDSTVVTGNALIEAWQESVPDSVARALDLEPGHQVALINVPFVVVRRIR